MSAVTHSIIVTYTFNKAATIGIIDVNNCPTLQIIGGK
ncbi:hypothetical protein RINTHM_15090 [Richelia intracellularis HM01]|nr:hypothetical protein RINTHM_15090 [Richelia intracellularis HM01]